MKLSEELKTDQSCGYYGDAHDGWADQALELEKKAEAFDWLSENPYYSFREEADCFNLEALYSGKDYRGNDLLDCITQAIEAEREG